jgi:hypothetical protein
LKFALANAGSPLMGSQDIVLCDLELRVGQIIDHFHAVLGVEWDVELVSGRVDALNAFSEKFELEELDRLIILSFSKIFILS